MPTLAAIVPQGKPRDGSVDLVAISKDPEWLARITDLRRDCTQLADEKVSIAQQVRAPVVAQALMRVRVSRASRQIVGTVVGARVARSAHPSPLSPPAARRREQAYDVIDAHIQKLDADLLAFEEALRRAGQLNRRDGAEPSRGRLRRYWQAAEGLGTPSVATNVLVAPRG